MEGDFGRVVGLSRRTGIRVSERARLGTTSLLGYAPKGEFDMGTLTQPRGVWKSEFEIFNLKTKI